MRKWIALAAGLVLVAVVIYGLTQSNAGSSDINGKVPTLEQAQTELKGSPPRLAALHAQANELLPGGTPAFNRRLKSLRGFPIVVNKWASWCGPCRFEYPFFAAASVKDGKRIAFLGLNSGDNSDDAQKFLDQKPVSYPSYHDPREQVARDIGVANNYPVTIYYDSDGKRNYVHQGAYASEAKLQADIKRYAK